METDVPSPPAALPPVIELTGVRKAFAVPGGEPLTILDIPAFAVAAGELVALEGQSGSGKSTLLNVIAGILRPDAGSVKIGGIDIVKLAEPMRDRLRADRVGLVFQQFNLLPGFTALENVLVAMGFGSRPADRGRAEALLAAVGLADRLHHKPAALSIGQQQRVAVARALANRPRVLLADEPTASIDPAHQQQVIDLLQTTCRDEQVSLVVVTHAPDVAAQFPVRYRLEDFNRAAAAHAPAAGQSAAAGGRP
jgi:putative ABC transport system ATP-binding protein